MGFEILIYGCVRSVVERGIFVPQGPHRGLQDLLCRLSGSVAAGPRLSCLAAHGILVPQPGIKPESAAWKVDS